MEPGSPADEAGMRAGDVLTSVGGEASTDAGTTAARLRGEIGSTVAVELTRRDAASQQAGAILRCCVLRVVEDWCPGSRVRWRVFWKATLRASRRNDRS